MPTSTREAALAVACGFSGNFDAALAVEQACEPIAHALGERVDLVMAFFTAAHVTDIASLTKGLHRVLRPRCLLGVSGESVLAGAIEVERAPGLAVFAARLPGVEIVPFSSNQIIPFDGETDEGLGRLAAGFGVSDDLRATIMFIDPFSVPLLNLLPAMNNARAKGSIAPILGGVASAAERPGGNRLIINERVTNSGLIGVSLRGPVRIDAVVSQGCRPIGPNLIVTKARKNLILELGGKPALGVVQDVVSSTADEDQSLVEKGVVLGVVVNEYKDRFGRDDYLIRNIVGAEETNGAIAINDFIPVGRTVRLHARDARTAHEDLAMLLDAQRLHGPPAGALVITCNGRGTRLFDEPNHDAAAFARAFRAPPPASEVAKGGKPIDPDATALPVAGFFAAGEIGPVGGESRLHGHTVCAALFRPISS